MAPAKRRPLKPSRAPAKGVREKNLRIAALLPLYKAAPNIVLIAALQSDTKEHAARL